jgi:intracellular sulfur oxidation DsrE/DsrF family protein
MSKIYLSMLLMILSSTVIAAPIGFSTGPVFDDYGSNIIIDDGITSPAAQKFKVVFDISEHDENGEVSRKFDTVARFINMHVRAGVPLENLDLAIVVHGKAGFDLMTDAAHQVKFKKANPNEQLLNLLLDTDVKVFVCGQSSSFLGIAKKDLNPGVKMSLSAMTANALLQQQGYSLNPF